MPRIVKVRHFFSEAHNYLRTSIPLHGQKLISSKHKVQPDERARGLVNNKVILHNHFAQQQ